LEKAQRTARIHNKRLSSGDWLGDEAPIYEKLRPDPWRQYTKTGSSGLNQDKTGDKQGRAHIDLRALVPVNRTLKVSIRQQISADNYDF
jgi:hypothetical protein